MQIGDGGSFVVDTIFSLVNCLQFAYHFFFHQTHTKPLNCAFWCWKICSYQYCLNSNL